MPEHIWISMKNQKKSKEIHQITTPTSLVLYTFKLPEQEKSLARLEIYTAENATFYIIRIAIKSKDIKSILKETKNKSMEEFTCKAIAHEWLHLMLYEEVKKPEDCDMEEFLIPVDHEWVLSKMLNHVF